MNMTKSNVSEVAHCSYKGRNYDLGMEVEVYRNLHTGGYSIRCASTKKVLSHAEAVELSDCRFIVSEKGRQRVITERKKYIHAFVRGKLKSFKKVSDEFLATLKIIYYNPYHTDRFLLDNEAVDCCNNVYLNGNFCYSLDGEESK